MLTTKTIFLTRIYWIGLVLDYDYRNSSEQETNQRRTMNDNKQLTKNVDQFRTDIDRVEQNEEDEVEEERRQDEIELDDEDFGSSIIDKPKTRNSTKTTSTRISSVNENEDERYVVRKKFCNHRHLIKSILEYPTALTDEIVQQFPDDLWELKAH